MQCNSNAKRKRKRKEREREKKEKKKNKKKKAYKKKNKKNKEKEQEKEKELKLFLILPNNLVWGTRMCFFKTNYKKRPISYFIFISKYGIISSFKKRSLYGEKRLLILFYTLSILFRWV